MWARSANTMPKTEFKLSHLSKRSPRKAVLSESDRLALLKKNWGDEAYKTIMRFRRIWDKEGAKLAP